jgi:hypothetical protein
VPLGIGGRLPTTPIFGSINAGRALRPRDCCRPRERHDGAGRDDLALVGRPERLNEDDRRLRGALQHLADEWICAAGVDGELDSRDQLDVAYCRERRFTRLTNGFSKKAENLQGALAINFAYYNYCRRHMTIRTTPAIAAGLTDRV